MSIDQLRRPLWDCCLPDTR